MNTVQFLGALELGLLYSLVTLGIYLKELNIKISDSHLFNSQSPLFYGKPFESIKDLLEKYKDKFSDYNNLLLEIEKHDVEVKGYVSFCINEITKTFTLPTYLKEGLNKINTILSYSLTAAKESLNNLMDSASNAYNTGKEHLTNTFNTGKEHLTNTYNSIYDYWTKKPENK